MTIRVSKSYVAAAAMAAAFLAPGIASADPVYDTSLANGVYIGHNNANSFFTVNTQNGIELGLSANIRSVTAVEPEAGSNVYDVPAGPTTAPGKTGSSWGIIFSLDTNPTGTGSLTLADISSLTFTVSDSATGFTSTLPFNLLTIPDNAYNGSTGAQNIEPGDFVMTFLGDTDFSVYADSTYTVTLTAYGLDQNVLASDEIVINTVPEPASLLLLGGGLAGLAALRRRKQV